MECSKQYYESKIDNLETKIVKAGAILEWMMWEYNAMEGIGESKMKFLKWYVEWLREILGSE